MTGDAPLELAATTVEHFPLREPCQRCGNGIGRIEPRSGQDCVFCASCGRFAYNAPRVETGRAPRTVATVHEGIRPKTRWAVLARANGRCELCGAIGTLHVSHLLSVKDGLDNGFTEQQLNTAENLAAFCEECNLGQGRTSVPPVLWLALMRKRLR